MKIKTFARIQSVLTHVCLASQKIAIGKQCIYRSDAAERGVWSESTLFALNTGISIKLDNNEKKKKKKKTYQIPCY